MRIVIGTALSAGAALIGLATGQSVAQSSMTSVSDDQLLASYVAYIGEDDLYNSAGDRLTQPWQIIRQDRANFHRFGIRDRWDESDPFFGDGDNRATMERMLSNGDITNGAARDIVRGGALILVEIFGTEDRGRSVRVTTAR